MPTNEIDCVGNSLPSPNHQHPHITRFIGANMALCSSQQQLDEQLSRAVRLTEFERNEEAAFERLFANLSL